MKSENDRTLTTHPSFEPDKSTAGTKLGIAIAATLQHHKARNTLYRIGVSAYSRGNASSRAITHQKFAAVVSIFNDIIRGEFNLSCKLDGLWNPAGPEVLRRQNATDKAIRR